MFEITDHGGSYSGKGLRNGDEIPAEHLAYSAFEYSGDKGSRSFTGGLTQKFNMVKKDRYGNYYTLGYHTTSLLPVLEKRSPNLGLIWSATITEGQYISDMTIDNQGNVYVAVTRKASNSVGPHVFGYNPSGTVFWQDGDTHYATNEGVSQWVKLDIDQITGTRYLAWGNKILSLNDGAGMDSMRILTGFEVLGCSSKDDSGYKLLTRELSTNKLFLHTELADGTLSNYDTGLTSSDYTKMDTNNGSYLFTSPSAFILYDVFNTYSWRKNMLFFSNLTTSSTLINELKASLPLITSKNNMFFLHQEHVRKYDSNFKQILSHSRLGINSVAQYAAEDPRLGEIYIGTDKMLAVFKPYFKYLV